MNKKAILFAALLGAAILALTGCENLAHDLHKKGGGAGKGKAPAPVIPSLTIVPGEKVLDRGLGYRFTVVVSGLSSDAVTWEVGGGNGRSVIGPENGFLTVDGDEADDAVLTVRARSVEDPAITDTAAVTVQPLVTFEGGGPGAGLLTITYSNNDSIRGSIDASGRVVFDPGSVLPDDCRLIMSIEFETMGPQLVGRMDDEGRAIRVNMGADGIIRLRSGTPVPIGTYEELRLINTDVASLAGVYRQEADLYLGDPAEGWIQEWDPIGPDDVTPFTGEYDGGGYLIDNLYIDRPAGEWQGLFGVLYGGELSTIRIGSGSSVTGDFIVGGVVGLAFDGTVADCTNEGAVRGRQVVGGVAGVNGEGIMNNCSNSGAVTATVDSASRIGGVAGGNVGSTGIMNNCFNTGKVTVTGTSSHEIGGVVGNNIADGILSGCYNTGAVLITGGNPDGVGGVAGRNIGATLSACYNSGGIMTPDNSENIGGVAGSNQDDYNVGIYDGVISACFNVGPVTGGSPIGGVAGYNSQGESSLRTLITACYNSGTVTLTGTGRVGGVVGKNQRASGTALVTACYNSGAVTVSGTDVVGGVVGENQNGATTTACYWLAGVPGANVTFGVGEAQDNNGAAPFAAGAWPQNSGNWTSGPAVPLAGPAGPGYWWRSLGAWNGGNPVFPKLYWE
jgi:hypothetical protein